MKNRRAILMIGIASFVGVIAMVLAANWVNRKSHMATAKVIVVAKDLDLGTRLTPDMLKEIDWPSNSLPPGAFNNIKALDTRVLKLNLVRGEPVLESKLAPLGTKGGLSAVISKGKRAITVKVNEVVGVAGFALPGNYVDILVHADTDNKKPISKIVLEHILVLAVAQEASRDETKPKVVNAVTLEVTPGQAEKLDLARSIGSLSLVLRNQVDKSPVMTTGVMRHALLGEHETPVPQKTMRRRKMAVIRAVKVSQPVRNDQIEVIKGVYRSNASL